MGFCLFSNAAVGVAAALVDGFRRIAIVDFDVHHGSGYFSVPCSNTPCIRIRVCHHRRMPYSFRFGNVPLEPLEKSVMSDIGCRGSEAVFDTHELVVFFHPLAACRSTGLDLGAAECDHEIGNKTVYRLP